MRLNENPLKGSGDMERTQNLRVIPMALNCDLDLESELWVLHTVSLRETS